jgi:hypothetical protein
MDFLTALTKAAKTFIEDYNTPESFKKGEKFEAYTREVIFPKAKYNLLKQHIIILRTAKDYVKESLEPDFMFECLETGQKFYVEAKVQK